MLSKLITNFPGSAAQEIETLPARVPTTDEAATDDVSFENLLHQFPPVQLELNIEDLVSENPSGEFNTAGEDPTRELPILVAGQGFSTAAQSTQFSLPPVAHTRIEPTETRVADHVSDLTDNLPQFEVRTHLVGDENVQPSTRTLTEARQNAVSDVVEPITTPGQQTEHRHPDEPGKSALSLKSEILNPTPETSRLAGHHPKRQTPAGVGSSTAIQVPAPTISAYPKASNSPDSVLSAAGDDSFVAFVPKLGTQQQNIATQNVIDTASRIETTGEVSLDITVKDITLRKVGTRAVAGDQPSTDAGEVILTAKPTLTTAEPTQSSLLTNENTTAKDSVQSPASLQASGDESNHEHSDTRQQDSSDALLRRNPNTQETKNAFVFEQSNLHQENLLSDSKLIDSPSTTHKEFSIQAAAVDSIVHPQGISASPQPTIGQLFGTVVQPDLASMQQTAANVPKQVAEAIFQVVDSAEQQELVRSVSLDLQPEELGRLRIHIEQTAESISATIVAAEAASNDLLQSQKQKLLESLAGLGYEHTNVDISHDQNRSSDQSDHRSRKANTNSPAQRSRKSDLDTRVETHPSGLNIVV